MTNVAKDPRCGALGMSPAPSRITFRHLDRLRLCRPTPGTIGDDTAAWIRDLGTLAGSNPIALHPVYHSPACLPRRATREAISKRGLAHFLGAEFWTMHRDARGGVNRYILKRKCFIQ
jgi:hypothetical protein